MKKPSFQAKETFKKRQVLHLGPAPRATADDSSPAEQNRRTSENANPEMDVPNISAKPARRAPWIGLCVLAAGIAVLAVGSKSAGNYTAHEWGTFTSVQGGDGVLLDWRPLESSRLPQFVYDWKKPGLNRQAGMPNFSKSVVMSLQRMETPVIYFYSDREETVDVSVAFPQGLITEWYPQACQIGPSTMPVSPAIAKLDELAHKVGAKPGFTFATLFGNRNVKESRALWANVHLLPSKQNAPLSSALPFDRSGSHYFAARDTDSDFLRLSSLNDKNPAPEHEKFIFYRGVGNFSAPLHVTMNSNEALAISNSGTEPLGHLFVLNMKDGAAGFTYVESLNAGQQRSVTLSLKDQANREQVMAALSRKMAESLAHEGLYKREAMAMVNTWKDSWFAEDGVRVLYVLPRAWTDRILPLTLDPAPRETVRVMVGRSEVLTPEVQQKLAEDLAKANAGDESARNAAIAEFKKLGRFAEPALRLATKGGTSESMQKAWSLYQLAAMPTPDKNVAASGKL
jgi:hypothetical protein